MSKYLMSLIIGTALLALMPLGALAADAPQIPYVVLDKSLSQLRADFNANVGLQRQRRQGAHAVHRRSHLRYLPARHVRSTGSGVQQEG